MHVMEFSKRKTAVQFAKLADHAIARDGIEWDGRKEGRVRGGSAHILQGYKEERKLIFGTEGSKRIMYSADQISLQEVA